MAELKDYPFVNQLNSPTLEGRADENRWFNCVICAIISAMLYRRPELRGKITPDSMKDAVLGEGYANQGIDARWFVKYVAQFGLHLYFMSSPDTIALAHQMIQEDKPAIFTEIDPYVDTSLPQYAGYTHVCSFYKEIPGGLDAMDPFGGKIVGYSDAEWTQKLRSQELWTVDLMEENVSIDISNPAVATYYKPLNANQWQCIQTGKILQYGILSAYCTWGNSALCGLTYLGLVLSNEYALDPVKYPSVVIVFFERGVLIYDPKHLLDNPPGAGSVYAAHLYSGPGQDPRLATAMQQIQQLQAQLAAQPPSQAQAILDKLKVDVPQAQAGLDKLKADLAGA